MVKLRQAAEGRSPDAPLLTHYGAPWTNYALRRPFRAIVEKSGLDPNVVTSYCLRHSHITMLLVRGVPIRLVARLCDTSVPMIEASYSASINDHGNVRHALLNLGAPADDKVIPITGRRT